MKKNFLMALLCLLSAEIVLSQPIKNYNALLWKVSGKNLQKPSYLFGTYHFLSNAFVDTIPAIMSAYKSADAVAGELIIDSSIQGPMMEAALLKGTTLKQVLPDTLYAKAADWFKQEAGVNMSNLDRLNPLTVMTVAMSVIQQKYFPGKKGEVQLDTYFQEAAKKDGKQVMGLETINDQINALFNQLTIPRQVALLNETFNDKDALKQMIDVMNSAYTSQQMSELQQLMYGSSYTPEEMKVLLDDRNSKWMQQLPNLMKEQSLFVAVGALHLVGDVGLVNQLRKNGYTVTPVNFKNQ